MARHYTPNCRSNRTYLSLLPQRLLNQLEPALRTLLARAVAGGYAREDVTAREILATVALICQPVPGEQPSFNQRMTRVFMQGLSHVG